MTQSASPPPGPRSTRPPALSVIVAVHKVEGYLEQCLSSILEQSFRDLELIAVDDCSPDHCGDILDEFAARDPRVRVIHLDHNVGLGPARNAGLDQAIGEYVWFVDGDDWLADGAARAVVRRLRDTDPDVLFVDYARASWDDKIERSDCGELLRAAIPVGVAAVRLADVPRLLEHHVVWNKVIRRSLLVRTELRFPVGWYEDVPFNHAVLIEADRVAALDRVCYLYRQRRQGAITSTRSDRHFEMFDQYERLFAYLDQAGPAAQRYRGIIFDRMVWHLRIVYGIDQRLPAGSRRDFYHRAAQFYRRYRPAGQAAPPGRAERVRRYLLSHDAYRRMVALRSAYRLGRWTRTATGGAGRTLRRAGRRLWRNADLAAKLAYYQLQLRLPIDDGLALYSAYWDRGYACNPAAIHRTATTLAPDVRGVFAVRPAAIVGLPDGVPFVRAGSFAYFRALARARWLINNVNFPDYVVKRAGATHVQTHHGTPLKVMGVDQLSYPAGQRGEDYAALLRRCDRWDLSITSNAHSTTAWHRAYPCRYETLEIGYPRNDRLARATVEDVEAVRAGLGLRPDQLVVLYAPTFREHHHAYSPVLDVEWLADELGANTVVLQRAHYFYAADTTRSHPRVRDVTALPCVEDLLLAADVLITDYSSVMFDYAVLDRPIVIYAPDWDTYRRTRGVTFDLRAEPPGPFTESFADLVTAFRTGAVDGDVATKARTRFRERFCALDDGGAAERAVRHIFAAELDEAEGLDGGDDSAEAPAPGRPEMIATDWDEPEIDEPEPQIPTVIRPAAPRTP